MQDPASAADPPRPASVPPPVASSSERVEGGARPRFTVRAIFDEHFTYVWRSLRRLGVPEADVDDALQEVFVVVHRKLAEFESRSRMTTWLFGICFRVASEYARRAHTRHEQASDELPEAPDLAASPEERYQGEEARARLDEVLDQLDPEKRAVFVLYEIDELSAEQIAATVGVPVGTVYSRLKAARQEFERALARLQARWKHAMGRGR
jgi:RNA polymerase sigma-70 factor (ECF subfamily)